MAKYTGDKNKLKEKFEKKYKNISPEYQKKINKFDRKIVTAEEIANKYYGKTKTNKSFDQIVEDLMDEYFSFKGSILNSFRELKTRTFEENVERAMQLRVKGRMYEFMKVNGEEMYEYNGKLRTLLGWEKQYLLGKIDNITFNKIIKGWQDNNPEYDNLSYKKHESRQAIVDEYTE